MQKFEFLSTHVGSVPHSEPGDLAIRLSSLLDIPAWAQHPRRTFLESMYVQYTPSLPYVSIDQKAEKVIMDTRNSDTAALETFYSNYLAEDIDAFALKREYAAGFYDLIDERERYSNQPDGWIKGQVTGPISFGLTVTDHQLRATLYDETLADVIIKNMAMIARWEIRQLKTLRDNVIIFLDEPYLASFGSAFISLSRDQVIQALNEVYEAIHLEGALGGVHCCANTDWGLLLDSQVDILNLDAYGFIDNLALYPVELRKFLDRGGKICWGIIPNNELIYQETPETLAARLRQGIKGICEKAAARGVKISTNDFETNSLIAPACGLGSATVETADVVFEKLSETGKNLQRG